MRFEESPPHISIKEYSLGKVLIYEAIILPFVYALAIGANVLDRIQGRPVLKSLDKLIAEARKLASSR